MSEVKKSRISKDDVKQAIEFVKSKNQRVNSKVIRDFLNAGSYTTVLRHMKELEVERENAEMKELEKNAKIESIDPEIKKMVDELTENLQLKVSEHFTQTIKAKDKQIEVLKNNNTSENERYNEISEQLEQNEQIIEELEISKSKAESKLFSIESSLDKQKTELEMQYNRLFVELHSKTDLLNQKELEIEQRIQEGIHSEKSKLTDEINRLNAENIALNKEIKGLFKSNGDISAQLLSVSNAHANAQASEKLKDSKIAELKNELLQIKSETKEERTQLQKKIDDLSKENADISRREAILITKNEGLERKNKAFEAAKKNEKIVK